MTVRAERHSRFALTVAARVPHGADAVTPSARTRQRSSSARRIAHVAFPAALAGAIALGPTAALADVGVGVAAATLRPRQPIAAGTSSELSWWVQNTGSQPGSFRLTAVPHRTAAYESMSVTWLTMHSAITLGAGAHDAVPVLLSVPAATKPGQYSAYLVATAETGSGHGVTTSVGAAAATAIEVTVTASRPAATSSVELALLGVTGLLGLGSFLTGSSRRKASTPGWPSPHSASTGRST